MLSRVIVRKNQMTCGRGRRRGRERGRERRRGRERGRGQKFLK